MYIAHNNHRQITTRSNAISEVQTYNKRGTGFCFIVLIVLFLTIHFPETSFASFIDLPRDANGWTVFNPSADTDVVYVDSATGNDTTCRSYRTTDGEMGSDPFNPAGAVLPCATAIKAWTFISNTQPDWVLFKRGSVFNFRLIPTRQVGRSSIEPMVFSSYGSSGEMPIITGGLETNGNSDTKYLAVSGLDFYRDTRDPDSPNYAPSGQAADGIFTYSNGTHYQIGVLIEGCRVRFFLNNVNIAPVALTGNTGFTFRRNVVLNAYSNNEGHSQGMFAYNIDGLIIEENIFDHNGWLVQSNGDATQDNGEATIFNHNAYLGHNKNMSVKNNIFIRGASNNTKVRYSDTGEGIGLVIDNNLYLGGEIAISIGPPDEHADYSVVNPQVTENVWLNPGKWNPTNREVAWFFYNFNWDGGNVSHNYMLHQTDDAITNGQFFHIQYTGRNITINNNVVYDVKNVTPVSLQPLDTGDPERSGIAITNNSFDTTTNLTVDAALLADVSAYSFSGNKYNTTKTADTWFNVNSSIKTNAQWQAITGDDSTFEQAAFPDSARTIESYMTYIGGTNTADAFIAGCRAQNRFNWNKRYTAETVNAWIKAGFSGSGGVITPKGFQLTQ